MFCLFLFVDGKGKSLQVCLCLQRIVGKVRMSARVHIVFSFRKNGFKLC